MGGNGGSNRGRFISSSDNKTLLGALVPRS
jgi:hypothetical protein